MRRAEREYHRFIEQAFRYGDEPKQLWFPSIESFERFKVMCRKMAANHVNRLLGWREQV